MDYQVEMDTTYIDFSEKQIKELHDRVFGETLLNDKAMGILVKLELTYIPFLLFIVIMVTLVNTRWNRTYKRILKISKTKEQTEERSQKMGILKAQKMNIWDRIFVYLVIWFSSLYIDTIMLASGVFTFPWLVIPVIILVISKKMKILSHTVSLTHIDDQDLFEGFDKILDDMIVKPLVNSVVTKFKNYFNQ